MSGHNIKVAAFMLVSILVVHGKIYQEDRYLMDSNHVESYHRSYSDNDGSDIFDDTDNKLHFDVPHPEIDDNGEPYQLPGFVEDNEPNVENNKVEEEGLPNLYPEDNYDQGQRRPVWIPNNMDNNGRGLPNAFPVDNRPDQDQRRPVWIPNNVDNNVRGLPNVFPVENRPDQDQRRPVSIPNNMDNNGRGLPNAFPVDNRPDQDQRRPVWIPNNMDNNVRGLPNVFPVGNRPDQDQRRPVSIPNNMDNNGRGLPNAFPVDNRPDQDQRRPVWIPNNMDNNVRGLPNVFPVGNRPDQEFPNIVDNKIIPSWFPGGNIKGRNKYPASKPGPGGMKKECQDIIGLPTPESGCCGVQMTRTPIVYPNKPWWPRFPGGRFIRSADNEILPSQMIRGGNATGLHQFPWMVRLTIDSSHSGMGSCGGTIISSRYVLTAAHCLNGTFENLKQITVILAEYDSDTYPDDCNGQGCVTNQERKVDRVIMHPDSNQYLQNDVALLRLSSDINYSDYIRPVCLTTEDIANQSEKPLIIAGWGLNGKTESNVKRSAIVKYVSNDVCKGAYSYKDESMFCSIGGNGEDICKGDSGGPLMVYSDGKYFLSGIVNGKRSDKQCGSTLPSLFNNVFFHLNWIKKHVQ